MPFIGIDLGTSFIKGAILDLESSQLHHVQRLPFPRRLSLDNPLLCEFRPDEVVAAVHALIDDLARRTPACEGIVMCAQMHGLVLLNPDGEVVSNCISWMDHRGLLAHPSGSGSCLDVLLRQTKESQRKRLGRELGLERPACFLFCLAQQQRLTPGLVPASLPDYVLSSLCRCEPGIDVTHASATGLYNLETGDWDRDVIESLHLDHLHFPPIRSVHHIVGYINVGSRSLPCYQPIGDHQCALLGALLTPEELSLNLSTGAQVTRITPHLLLGDHQTRPFFEGQYINTYSDAPGGRALNVLVDLLTGFAAASGSPHPSDPWKFIAEAAQHVSDTSLEVDPSFFDSADALGGSIRNIRGDNFTFGHLFRACFNGMADIYDSLAARLWPGRSWNNIVFSGGLALKLQILRDVVQRKLQSSYRLSPSAEDTLLGLLLLARVVSGRDPSIRQSVESFRATLPSKHIHN